MFQQGLRTGTIGSELGYRNLCLHTICACTLSKSPDSITSNFDSFEHQEWLVLKKHCIDNSSVSTLLKYISVLVYHIKCTCRRMSSSYSGSTKLVSIFYVLFSKRSRNIFPLVLISIIGRSAISALQDFQYQLLRIKSGTNKM